MIKSKIPNCEKHIEYLFARFHHLLGFERVLDFRNWFPDVIALRNGKITRVELEYNLMSAKTHYYIYPRDQFGMRGKITRIEHRDGYWIVYRREPLMGKEEILCKINDEGGNVYRDGWSFKRRSLKPVVDVIVYWYKGEGRWHDYSVELINLQERLKELGVTW